MASNPVKWLALLGHGQEGAASCNLGKNWATGGKLRKAANEGGRMLVEGSRPPVAGRAKGAGVVTRVRHDRMWISDTRAAVALAALGILSAHPTRCAAKNCLAVMTIGSQSTCSKLDSIDTFCFGWCWVFVDAFTY